MPKSKPWRRSKAKGHDALLRAELRAERKRSSQVSPPKRRLGWPICIVGVCLFVATYVANVAGRILLPFDHHHIIGQVAGAYALLAFTGLRSATS